MGTSRSNDRQEDLAFALRVYPKFAAKVLFVFLAVLLLFDLAVAFAHLQLGRTWTAFSMLFDMDREGNVPTLFNVLLFLLSGLLFYFRSRAETGRSRWPWLLMSAITIFLAVDEGSQVHERFMVFTLKLLGGGEVQVGEMGWLFYAWIIPYGIAALALLLVLAPWFMRLSQRTRNGFLLAGAIYVGGAVFVEAWSGKLAEQLMVGSTDATPLGIPCEIYQAGNCFLYADVRIVLLCALEETLEMTGLIVCVRTLLGSLDRHGTTVLVNIASTRKADQ